MCKVKKDVPEEEESSTATVAAVSKDVSNSNDTEAHKNKATPILNTWPEDDMENHGGLLGLLSHIYQRWTFSYLNPLLQLGSLQRKNGFKLDQQHLFNIPQSMSSIHLNEHFRYVQQRGVVLHENKNNVLRLNNLSFHKTKTAKHI